MLLVVLELDATGGLCRPGVDIDFADVGGPDPVFFVAEGKVCLLLVDVRVTLNGLVIVFAVSFFIVAAICALDDEFVGFGAEVDEDGAVLAAEGSLFLDVVPCGSNVVGLGTATGFEVNAVTCGSMEGE